MRDVPSWWWRWPGAALFWVSGAATCFTWMTYDMASDPPTVESVSAACTPHGAYEGPQVCVLRVGPHTCLVTEVGGLYCERGGAPWR